MLRPADENPTWGYRRIHGELHQLGLRLAASTVWTILRNARRPPVPDWTGRSWSAFIAPQAKGIVATDSFTVDTVLLRRFHVLFLARSAEHLAVEYRLRLGLTLTEAVIPMGDLLGRIVLAGSEERAGLQGQLRQRVVDAAAALARPERSRAVFFALEGRTLRAAAWAGRAEPPQHVLVRSDPEAEAAYRLMERHASVLVPDVEDAHALDFGLGGEYASFLCVTVYAATRSFGILSVDAPEPEALDDSDVDIVASLAQTLGPGLAIT